MSVINGDEFDNPLVGTSDDDSISGFGGSDTLDGGEGTGNDTLDGGDGDDRLFATLGNDSIVGGAGTDILSFAQVGVAITGSLTGGFSGSGLSVVAGGIEVVVGSDFDDSLAGDAGDNDLRGGLGNDTLVAGGGADQLSGDDGDDRLVVGLGTLGVDGGLGGLDTLDLSQVGTGIVLAEAGDSDTLSIVGTGLAMVAAGIERVLGTALADTMDISGLPTVIFEGGGGNDTITGSLVLDPPHDGNVLDGGAGNDSVRGSIRDDTIHASTGQDRLEGGAGTDLLSFERAGAAVVLNLAVGVAGAGAVIGGADTAPGFDTVSGFEAVLGSAFNDSLTGSDAAGERLAGAGGDDLIAGGGGDDSLTGDAGSDTVNGGAGNDTIDGGTGANRLDGGAGADLIFDGSGHDSITGGDGDDLMDVLNGGSDTAEGGTGNDTVRLLAEVGLDTDTARGGSVLLDDGIDLLVVVLPAGTPPGGAGVSVDLGLGRVDRDGTLTASIAGFERVIATDGTDTLVGDALDNTLEGGAGADVVDGGGGADTVVGGAGVDTLSGGAVDDGAIDVLGFWDETQGVTADLALATTSTGDLFTGFEGLYGSDHDDRLRGDAAANYLFGAQGDDVLFGRAGNDTLDAGAGAAEDILVGGDGDDTYLVRDVRALLVETSATGGTDTVITRVSLTLAAHLENLTLAGGADLDGTGNGLANLITGNAAANRLAGGAGGDTLAGGAGDDVYVLEDGTDGSTDLVQDSAGAADRFVARNDGFGRYSEFFRSGSTFVIEDYDELSTGALLGRVVVEDWTGTGRIETLQLDETGGSTLLAIAAANVGGAGRDLVVGTAVADTLTGAGDADVLFAYLGDDSLDGGAGDDALRGGAGNDTLTGGAGADELLGQAGNDVYHVDATTDVVDERKSYGPDADDDAGGIDTVHALLASGTYTLGAFVEKLVLQGTARIGGNGNALANTITGNGSDNALAGGAGNDTLDGSGGLDTLTGGSGADVYLVDNTRDLVVEATTAAAEIDTVQARVAWTLGANVENLVLLGTAILAGTGNTLANTITGNAAANTLDGKAGKDVLAGGAGADSFAFTTALGATSNVDRLADFKAVDDRLLLDDAVFRGIGARGALAAGAFVVGTKALDANDRIVYDRAGGKLFFDADGSGAGAAVLFATVAANTVLTAADVFIV